MAGTAAGTVFLYTITTSIRIAKEIQLKHGAPVLSIIVLDSNSNPIHSASNPPHKFLITSEEQIKIFSLPNLRPLGKVKVTAHDGVRVRKLGIIRETLLVLSNSGEIAVLGVQDMRRLGKGACCRNGVKVG
jgi:lethal(2) giant larvae protein